MLKHNLRDYHQNILITGGCGFIGSNLAKHLLETYDDVNITLLDNISTGSLNNITQLLSKYGERITYKHVDLSDNNQVNKLINEIDFNKIEICFHFAASIGVKLINDEPYKSMINSMKITENMINIFNRFNIKVIYGSTSEVYGETIHNCGSCETDNLSILPTSSPRSSYAASKLFTEHLLQAQSFKSIIVRFFNVVGTSQKPDYGHILPNFIERLSNKEKMIIHNNGTDVRSYCHIDDVCEMLGVLLDKYYNYPMVLNIGERYNTISVIDLADLFVEHYYNRLGNFATLEEHIELIPFDKVYKNSSVINNRFPNTSKINEVYWELTNKKLHTKPISLIVMDIIYEYKKGNV